MLNKQRGFTLVEIAIVLVIIGLLLGGILKGQELVTAARVRNLADQAAGVQAAYYGFLDRYRAVPGDMLAVNTCTAIGNTAPGCPGVGVGGDGDQVIENFPEAAAAWGHLAAAGFLQGSYPGVAANEGAYIAAALPAAPTNPWNGFLVLGTSPDYVAAGPPRLALITGNQVPVNVMREYDVKVDDSFPDSGILRSALPAATIFIPTVGAEGPQTCVAGAVPNAIWDIPNTPVNCNGYFLF